MCATHIQQMLHKANKAEFHNDTIEFSRSIC